MYDDLKPELLEVIKELQHVTNKLTEIVTILIDEIAILKKKDGI